MYQKAKRLAALSGNDGRADESLTAGCQAYLTAVNSLSLVAEDQQWILVKAEGDDSSAARLAAVSCECTIYSVASQAEALLLLIQARKYQRVLDAPLADPDVITLNAIRTEYVSALARLQLSQHFPELNRGSQSHCLIFVPVRILTIRVSRRLMHRQIPGLDERCSSLQPDWGVRHGSPHRTRSRCRHV
jgi:hypothetical protein